ncbi:hypothetical protein [Cysteiniphilum litorale]|uniref:hypothetical protein n=1 Tax=Cysteiniphilum litorale TaxID=2056700 RepID=UPI003F884D92
MHKYSFARQASLSSISHKLLLSIVFFSLVSLLSKPVNAQSLYERYHTFFSNFYLSDIPLRDAGKIIASSKGQALVSSGDTVYVSKSNETPFYYIFSHVNSIPYAKDKYDYIFKRLGKAEFISNYQGTLVMRIMNITQEINIGDHVLPSDLVQTKLPNDEIAADSNISGEVTQLEGEADFAGTYQSVLINTGQSAGLKMGMRVYFESPAKKVDGYAIPGQFLGQGFVYRLASHHAIALVTNAQQEVMIGSTVLTQLPKHHAKHEL